MYGFPLDHIQGFVIISDCYMFATNICMELFKTIANREAFPFYVHVPTFNIAQCFTGKCDGSIILG